MAEVSLTPMHDSDADWLHDVATAYFHELVPQETGPPRAEIDDWFSDPDIQPLLIAIGQKRAGFALIERTDQHHELSEFGIVPNWRNSGIGATAATMCFQRFPGKWSLGVASALPGTPRFWDRLLPTLPGIERLARGPALTPYQSHSYTFAIRDDS